MITQNKIHKMKGITDRVEVKKIQTKRKAVKLLRSWKLKLIVVLLSLSILGGVCLMAFYQVSKFYDANRVIFQYPIIIKLQPMIKIERRNIPKPATKSQEGSKKSIILPIKSEFEIVNGQKHGQILWKIYQLESQRGLTDSCRKSGAGFGGFGVMNAGEVICYESFEKAVERAEYWFAKLEPEKSLVSALCQWQSGTPNLVNCMYYQNYLSL